MLVGQIIERIIELNDVADRGQPINMSALMQDSWDEMDDVFDASQPKQHHRYQQQLLLHNSARLNTTVNNSAAPAPVNTSFDFRASAAPPVQVRETTM